MALSVKISNLCSRKSCSDVYDTHQLADNIVNIIVVHQLYQLIWRLFISNQGVDLFYVTKPDHCISAEFRMIGYKKHFS